MAGSWLPPAGKYKIFSSFQTIDKRSSRLKKAREENYLNLQKQMFLLAQIKAEIEAQIKKHDGEPTNNERRALANIKEEMELLKQNASEQKAYSDEEIGNVLVEYGIDDVKSIGLKLEYKTNKFIEQYRKKDNVNAKLAEFFFKYQLFNNDKLVLTILPGIYFDKYNAKQQEWFGEIGMLGGYSYRTSYNSIAFIDVGVSMQNCIGKNCNTKNVYSVSLTEGVKLKNGILFYNFIKYDFRKTDNSIYKRSYYKQISVAKVLNFGNFNPQPLTLSLGYFINQSLIDPAFKLSGPIFSLWLEL